MLHNTSSTSRKRKLPTPLEIALGYLKRCWNPIPVSRQTKKPIGNGWQRRRLDSETVAEAFNSADMNVGVQLGASSDGLTDVDLDCREAVAIGPMLLPKSNNVFGRASKRCSHWLYTTTLAERITKAGLQFKDTDGTMMLELKIGGANKGSQSVFPGSVHVSGEAIEWDQDGALVTVDDDELLRQVHRLAVAVLLARHWPAKGGRHEAALTVGGFLARAGLDEDEAARMLEAIATAAGDDEVADRVQAARDAVGRHGNGGETRGYPALADTFDLKVATKSAAWLDYKPQTVAKQPAKPPPPKCSREEVHAVFRKWLGEDYDLAVLDVVCAAAAAERLTGDPLWVLVISGPGAAKTETVQALEGAGAHVTSTIASEGALLSATRPLKHKPATGGLLRKMGARGVLVVKDVTSILSMDRNTRATVLGAIREVHDGKYERNVGTDGGQTLTWRGRIVIVGAVTTAWDTAHAVIAVMGDRFVTIRIDSKLGRVRSGLQAIGNTGDETQMREELAVAVGGLVLHASTEDVRLSEVEHMRLVKAADIVTMARTAVERDYQGNVIDAHAPEMPTRFAKQLTQMVRGGVAIGMTREEAMRLAIRCARDSIPPLRLEILVDVAVYPKARPGDVRARIDKPWRTVQREMEALHILGVLRCDEEEDEGDDERKRKTIWRYSLADGYDRDTLLAMAGRTPQLRMGVTAAGLIRLPSFRGVRVPARR